MDVSTYAHDAINGTVHCMGPYDVWDVYQLLIRSTPEQSEAAKAAISARSYYRWWPPATLRALAGYLVAEAHGGADCTPYDGPSQAAAAAIEVLYAQVAGQEPAEPAEPVNGAEPAEPVNGAEPAEPVDGAEPGNGVDSAALPSWIGPAALVGLVALVTLRGTR